MNQVTTSNNTYDRPVVMAASLGACAALFYGLTMTSSVTQDSMAYAASALRGGWVDWLHPHHLLYNSLLALVLRITGNVEPTVASLHALQMVNVVLSGLAVGLFYVTLRKLGSGKLPGLVLTLLFAVSNGIWLYSSQIEVYNLSALFIIGTILALLVERERGRPLLLVGTLCCALSMLFHQTALFFVLGLLAYGLVAFSGSTRMRFLFRYVALPLLIVGILYLLAAWYVTGSPAPSSVLHFATSYAHTGQWGKVEGKNFPKAVIGFVDGFAAVGDIRTTGLTPVLGVGLLLLAAGALMLVGSFRPKRTLVEERPPLLLLFGTWFLLHAGFVWWWYPSNVEFWIMTVPCIILIAALFLTPVLSGDRTRYRLALAGMSLLVVAELVLNSGTILHNRNHASTRVETARMLASAATDRDLVVVASQPGLIAFVQYFSPGRVVYLYDPQVVLPEPVDPQRTQQAIDGLSTLFRSTIGKGGKVITEQGALGSPQGAPGGVTVANDQLDSTRIKQWISQFRWQQPERERKGVYVLTEI